MNKCTVSYNNKAPLCGLFLKQIFITYNYFMSKEIKKTSAEWIKEVGYEVIDPDGWDRDNFDYSWNKEKITMIEFQIRLMKSTVKRKLLPLT